ncbi:hypothetical protein FYJ26_05905 [Anaerococcus sp. WCA-380-WT-2B]|uniref:Uncharacterized protein n=1 Tax=Anaerococcus porci TaxID=2652269 RepID=A0A6N7VSX1_9FIRM|nr:hypothetical protein [Anaerococcus porci]
MWVKNNDKVFEQVLKDYGLEDLNKEDLEIFYNNSIDSKGGIQGIVLQNYIMIRQLDRLSKNIEKLLEK